MIKCPRWGKLEKPGHNEVDQETRLSGANHKKYNVDPPVVNKFSVWVDATVDIHCKFGALILYTHDKDNWSTVLNVATVVRGRSQTLLYIYFTHLMQGTQVFKAVTLVKWRLQTGVLYNQVTKVSDAKHRLTGLSNQHQSLQTWQRWTTGVNAATVATCRLQPLCTSDGYS